MLAGQFAMSCNYRIFWQFNIGVGSSQDGFKMVLQNLQSGIGLLQDAESYNNIGIFISVF